MSKTLCKTCKYFFAISSKSEECCHKEASEVNMVNGRAQCSQMRDKNGLCGPDAELHYPIYDHMAEIVPGVAEDCRIIKRKMFGRLQVQFPYGIKDTFPANRVFLKHEVKIKNANA